MVQSLDSWLFISGSAGMLLIATGIVLFHIVQYCRNLAYPYAQKHCMALFAVPILLGWTSWMNLLNANTVRLVAFCVNLCKATGVLAFLQYIEAMLGRTIGDGSCFYSEARADQAVLAMRHAHCYLRCTRGTALGSLEDVRQFRWRTRLFILQYPVVILFLSILVGVVRQVSTDADFSHTFTFGATVVQTISASIAVNFLINYALFTSTIPEVKEFKIFHKFVLVKVSMFFTEAQPLVISALAWIGWLDEVANAEQMAAQLNSILVCCEMILIGYLQYKMFPVTEYTRCVEQTELVSTAKLLPSHGP